MAPPVTFKHADAKALRKAALAYPDAVEDFPWGDTAFKVAGKKVFLFMGPRDDGGFSCSMKLPFRAEDALQLKNAQPTGYGLGRAGWVTFTFTAKAKAPMAKLTDWRTRAGAPSRPSVCPRHSRRHRRGTPANETSALCAQGPLL